MTTCVQDAVGVIGDRWRETGAEFGPLGCPLGPEVRDGAGNWSQVFERGEIAWCPGQDMVLTCYRLRDYACFEWQLASEHYHYEWWQFEAFIDGRPMHRAASSFSYNGDVPHRTRRGRMPMRIQSAGRYEFEVRGCDDPDGDSCNQGWTKRVGFTVGQRGGNPYPGDAPVEGLIADRWHLYDAWDGPLGRPLGQAVTLPDGTRHQPFEGGHISVDPRFGDLATVLYKHGEAVFLTWGPGSYPEAGGLRPTHYRVDWHRPQGDPVVTVLPPDDTWIEFSCGGYQCTPEGPPGLHELRLYPGLPDSMDGELGPAQPVPSVFCTPHDGMDLEPLALGGSPAAAVASDAARIRAVVDAFAGSQTVLPAGQLYSNEDLGALLVAHLQAVRNHRPAGDDAGYRRYTVPGGWLPAATMVNEALLNLRPTSVGTDSGEDLSDLTVLYCTKINGEYDTLLKHLIAIAYRYDDLLQPRVREHLRGWLLSVRGPHDEHVETKQLCCNWSELGEAAVAASGLFFGPVVLPLIGGLPCIPIPESENHLLLIESTRYLTNQLLGIDNGANGLRRWLLTYLQTAARHDFLEFNARPYLRYTTNALLNLAEFADAEVSTAAQLLLDYLTVKFAVSSSRLRRLGPFRRLRNNSFSEEPVKLDDLYAAGADPMTGFFHQYAGPPPLADGTQGRHIPKRWFIECLLAGLAPYRPPVAAYVLALDETWTGTHSFHLGLRPPILAGEQADAGIESYYRTPKFLLTSGGIFLNSGSGFDGIAKYKNAAMPQPITLLPTLGALTLDQIIRLDVWPDVRNAVNTAAFHGFACGANLHVPGWLKDPATPLQGWYTFNLDADRPEHGRLGLYVAALVTQPAEIYDVGQPDSAWPRNWAFFYAMEASIPFEEFERRTIEANRDLIPGDASLLRSGVDYVFNAPDGKRVEFVIAPSSDRQFGARYAKGDRYSSRIQRVGDATAPPDLQRLPLVAGEFLWSDGHRGRLEFSYPGCVDIPRVLDFTDAEHPARSGPLACGSWYDELWAAYLARALDRLRNGDAAGALELTHRLLDEFRRTRTVVPGLSNAKLYEIAGRWHATAQAAHPADVPVQLGAAGNAWLLYEFLAADEPSEQQRASLAPALTNLSGYLAFGSATTTLAVGALDVARGIFAGLPGDHRIDIAGAWAGQARFHHEVSFNPHNPDRVAELARQRAAAAESLAIVTPMLGAVLPAADLLRLAAILRELIGFLTFGSPDSAPSVRAAEALRAVYAILPGDHRIDVAESWAALALRQHETSVVPGCPDPAAERLAQRTAAASSFAILEPMTQALPDALPDTLPDVADRTRVADILRRLIGLLTFGGPDSAPSVRAAAALRAVYATLPGDHRIDVAESWAILAMRHHETSAVPGCPDPAGEQHAQRLAAKDGTEVLIEVGAGLPDPAVGAADLARVVDLLGRLIGLLTFGAAPPPDPETAQLQRLADAATALRDQLAATP